MTSGRPGSGPPGPHPLLRELVDEVLDPGYAAAARRRRAEPGRRWYDAPAVALGCLLAGFVLVVAYVHTNRSAPEAQQVHDALVTRVRAAQSAAARLGAHVDRIQRELARQRAEVLPTAGRLAQELEQAQMAAGQTAVHGPGLEVTLSEPPAPSPTAAGGRAGTTPIAATHILTDRDVRSVVNELWRDGAEAIAVNGIRLTSTSAIRFAGQAVLVDFQPIASPYTIEAIGNPNALSTSFAESAAASRYKTLAGVEGIGFTFTEGSDLRLPAGSSEDLRYAGAEPTGPSSPGSSRSTTAVHPSPPPSSRSPR